MKSARFVALLAGWMLNLGTSVSTEAEDAPPAAIGAASGTGVAASIVADPRASVISLDGEDWLLAPDPKNAGREEKWFEAPRPEAKRTKVPWIIQDAFPGYHGIAWYWRDFEAPPNPLPKGRCLLRFWAVDYTAEVWLNGRKVGDHEGGETPFVLDVTDAIRAGMTRSTPATSARNRLAVRVLNPTHERIDGIVLGETPHRNKALPYSSGSAWDQGGIIDSVELILAPVVRVEDLFARADWRTGVIRVQVNIRNAADEAVDGRVDLTVAPAAGGETLSSEMLRRRFPPGDTLLDASILVSGRRAWDLNDPFLYRVTARVTAPLAAALDARTPAPAVGAAADEADFGEPIVDEATARCGFRDFRFERGAFRLNGRRLYLKCSHTGNCCPIGLELPHDPDILRRDLLLSKTMGFNAIRFIAGVAKRYQLDLCDEIGLMVYEEAYASWCLADSPFMPQRYAESILGMVRRDRNHPSVTMWGLLNETPEGSVFRQAVGILPKLRALDDSRLVMLNSGRWDAQGGVAGIQVWRNDDRTDPCVTRNGTDHVVKALGITWAPGQLAFHPGLYGEYAVVRWTAPEKGQVGVEAVFRSIAERATTDVHVLHNGKALFDDLLNLDGRGMETRFRGSVAVEAGDTLCFACGFGNGNYGADTTALDVTIKTSPEKVSDAAKEFSADRNPNGPWSFGAFKPGPKPDAATFTLFPRGLTEEKVGSLSNPGSPVWEDVMSDQHPYQRVPHTAAIINTLRTLQGNGLPVFLSEYGIGSAMDLLRVVRHYERLGKTEVEDARLYRSWRDLFLADWERWRMAEVFDRPEDFFAQSIGRMAGQRLLGINAIRSNPGVIGYSITGTVDQGMTAEGLWTTFRELKPGTVDAVADGWSPLRFCLFAEPVNAYRGGRVRLEAVLANEDQLAPGDYPVILRVVGPGVSRAFERSIVVKIPERAAHQGSERVSEPPAGHSELPMAGPEPPMVMPLFAEDVAIDGPSGCYRFLADFERGAAAAGGETTFHVYDRKDMPPVGTDVVLWGEDAGLQSWLADHSIATRRFSAQSPERREAILVCGTPEPPGTAAVFADLAGRIARGSTAVFLSPSTFAGKGNSTGWLPLANKGAVAGLPSWLYHKDDWAKRHPIFDGLPAGGLMDYTVYREVIPDGAFVGLDSPDDAVAAGINASQGYSSGLLVAVYRLGAGRFVINTLQIRENLGPSPVAERLFRNLLRFAAQGAGEPLAPAPEDLGARLKALGYFEE